jgi:hypothetical protein
LGHNIQLNSGLQQTNLNLATLSFENILPSKIKEEQPKETARELSAIRAA